MLRGVGGVRLGLECGFVREVVGGEARLWVLLMVLGGMLGVRGLGIVLRLSRLREMLWKLMSPWLEFGWVAKMG